MQGNVPVFSYPLKEKLISRPSHGLWYIFLKWGKWKLLTEETHSDLGTIVIQTLVLWTLELVAQMLE